MAESIASNIRAAVNIQPRDKYQSKERHMRASIILVVAITALTMGCGEPVIAGLEPVIAGLEPIVTDVRQALLYFRAHFRNSDLEGENT